MNEYTEEYDIDEIIEREHLEDLRMRQEEAMLTAIEQEAMPHL